MQEEIFGPILPILSGDSVDEAIQGICAGDKPLAMYLFSHSRATVAEFLERTSSGMVAVNAAMIQGGAPALPFGGVGGSGMGRYYGEFSLQAFSHEKPVLRRGRAPNLTAVFRLPYTRLKSQMIRKS